MYKSALRFLTRRGSAPCTRDRKPPVAPSEPLAETAEVDNRRDPRERSEEPPIAEPLLAVSFDFQTCTLADAPTDAEQAAYDAHRRACESWEEFWERAPSADWMLDALRGQWDSIPVVPERQLRTFALRCIEGLHGTDHAGLQGIIQAVTRRVDGKATLQQLARLQEKTRGFVSPGGAMGVPRCSPHAAGALAVWHTAGHSPYEAAFWTAEFAARHDAFVALEKAAASWTCPGDRIESWRQSWHTRIFATAHPAIYMEALSDARRRQADLLRSSLPHPFALLGSPVRGEVYLGQENDAGRVPVYCLKCGAERDGTKPGVLFDIRRAKCEGCGVALVRGVS